MAVDFQDGPCKGCSASVTVSEEQIQRILASLQRKHFEMVSDEVYEKRLAECKKCPSLQYENTCSYCGCIVQVRAKFKDKHCPYPFKNKW